MSEFYSQVAIQTLTADRAFNTAIKALVKDKRFQTAWEKLDFQEFSDAFNAFSDNIIAYNQYHRMEGRLWSVKLGKGVVAKPLEEVLRRQTPIAKKHYTAAMNSIDACLAALEDAGFDEVLPRHLNKFMSLLKDREHPLRNILIHAFATLDCSASMLEDFDAVLARSDYDPIRILGTVRPRDLRVELKKAVEAQHQIFDYTEAHGLSYLKGKCGPPAWAVTASAVLAYFGISVAAWVIVAIVATVVALLIILCATEALPASILSKCKYLSIKLQFTF